VIPQRQLLPMPHSARSRFGQKRSAPAHPSVICAAGCHRVIVPRPKGCRPLARSMPAPRLTAGVPQAGVSTGTCMLSGWLGQYAYSAGTWKPL
jgi:hypothetical protein